MAEIYPANIYSATPHILFSSVWQWRQTVYGRGEDFCALNKSSSSYSISNSSVGLALKGFEMLTCVRRIFVSRVLQKGLATCEIIFLLINFFNNYYLFMPTLIYSLLYTTSTTNVFVWLHDAYKFILTFCEIRDSYYNFLFCIMSLLKLTWLNNKPFL